MHLFSLQVYLSIFHDYFSYIGMSIFLPKDKKCTVFTVNVPYFYASVPGKVHRMLAGLAGSDTGFQKGEGLCNGQSDTTRSIVVIWVNFFQTERTKEIQPVRPIEVCGKV